MHARTHAHKPPLPPSMFLQGITFGFIAFSFIQLIMWTAAKVSEKVPALAPYLKPGEKEDTSLPHPLMVVLSIFFIFRYRYLGL